jgi:replicative DNA helicase
MREIVLNGRNAAIERVLSGLNERGECVSTGFPKLDRALGGGLFNRKAYGLQARKKIGKTILMGSISYNLNEAAVPHLWLACEMSDFELEQRHLGRALHRNSLDFLSDNSDNLSDEVLMYRAAAPDNIYYANVPGLSVNELSDTVERAVKDHGIRGFFLDYLQLVRGSGDRVEHLENVSNAVVSLVKELDVWAIVAAQLNQEDNTRGGEGMLLAFDMVFSLRRPKFSEGAWLEMMESRYTPYMNIGCEKSPGLMLEMNGPHFREI